MPNFTLVALEM